MKVVPLPYISCNIPGLHPETHREILLQPSHKDKTIELSQRTKRVSIPLGQPLDNQRLIWPSTMSSENKTSTSTDSEAENPGLLSGVSGLVGGLTQTVGGAAGGLVGTLGETVGTVGKGVGDTVGGVSEGLGETTKSAGGMVQDSTGKIGGDMKSNENVGERTS